MTVEPIEGATPTAEKTRASVEEDRTSADEAAPETTPPPEPADDGAREVTASDNGTADSGTAQDNGTDPSGPPTSSATITSADAGGTDGTAAADSSTAAPAPAAEPTAIPPGAQTADTQADETQAPDARADETQAPDAQADETQALDAQADASQAPRASSDGSESADDVSSPAAAIATTDGESSAGAPDSAEETATTPAADATPSAAAAAPDRPEPTTMEELLSEQTDEIRSLKHGDVVEGQVVRIDKDEILVDIGAKSEGVVSNRELYGRNAESQPQLDIGDTVLVYVLQPESNEGHAVLSLRRAGLERKWRAMQEQLDAGVIIEAPVIDHNKGGLIVDCGIRGFVPISQIVDFPRRPQNEQPRDAAQEIAEKLQPYVGRRLRLKILEVNRKANRLILSEKVALYEERREKRDELFSSLQVGQRVTGSVRSIAPFGVFVDLGGIDGLVHKSELSWNKVNNPEAGYRVGEEVEAEVIDINHERGRISLSIRRLQPDPWHSTVADLKVGDIIEGTVTKIVNFGSFVRVRDGLEGLIHISELSHQRVAHPGDVVHEGQKLDLKVISLDSERHRLGLSLKQAEEAPARPAPSAPEARDRRGGRQERSFDPSQAVQEPEEGIDNTLAAAFAQVRQQVADSEAAAAHGDEPGIAAAQNDELATAVSAEETASTAEPEPDAEPTEPGAAAEPEPEATAEADASAQDTSSAEPDAAAEPTEPDTAAAPEPEATAEADASAQDTSSAEPEASAQPTEPDTAAEPEPEATAVPTAEPKSSRKSKRAASEVETPSTDGSASSDDSVASA